MAWKTMREPPSDERRVLVTNVFGGIDYAYAELNTDGSRNWYGAHHYIDEEKLYRFMWCEMPTPPTDEEWATATKES